jgi:hypothetical protein
VEEEVVSSRATIAAIAVVLALIPACSDPDQTEAPFQGPLASPDNTCAPGAKARPADSSRSTDNGSLFSARLPAQGAHPTRLRDGRRVVYTLVTAHREPCFADFAIANEQEILELLDSIWRAPGLPSPVADKNRIAAAMRVALDNLFRSRTAADAGLISAELELSIEPARAKSSRNTPS